MSNYHQTPTPRNNTFDGLHPQFVNAMRTLFEIMDERKCGYVKFSDIESRWQDGESLALPRGVLESLRKVTPPNGLLSFERFCAGLKICLLRHKAVTQNSFNHPLQTSSSGSNLSGNTQQGGGQHHEPLTRSKSAVLRPASVPLPDREGATSAAANRKSPTVEAPTHGGGGGGGGGNKAPVPGVMQRSGSASENNWVNNHVNTATVRPNNAAVNRTVSMPQLQGENRGPVPSGYPHHQGNKAGTRGHPMVGMREYRSESKIPTVPDHPSWNNPRATANVRPNRRLGIRAALENWKNGMLNNETDQQMFQARAEKVRIPPMNQQHPPLQRCPPPPPQPPPPPPPLQEQYNRPTIMRSKSSTAVVGQQQPNNNTNTPPDAEENSNNRVVHETGPAARRAFNRRREPRRHTLANGIDYSMLKRMKQMEQERDILLQGYQTIERGREWFLARLAHVQDKMHFWGKNNYHSEYSSDVHQERLNLEMTRILEVNQNINALIESTEKGHIHMNLAVRSPINKMQYNSTQTHIHRLKEQNRMLTEEVGKKSEYITQLEKEKSALVRELFQSRSQQPRHHVDDTTFM